MISTQVSSLRQERNVYRCLMKPPFSSVGETSARDGCLSFGAKDVFTTPFYEHCAPERETHHIGYRLVIASFMISVSFILVISPTGGKASKIILTSSFQ